MPVTEKSLAGYVAMTGKTLNLPDAYSLAEDAPYQLDRSFDQRIAYRTCSILVLPMQNQKGETIGVLQLINRKLAPDLVITVENASAITQPFSDWEERVVRSLASQAAISIERNHLQESIEHLFEGFVRASVQIIETRDPCTSGHSEPVAALTVRLAQEVNSVATGALASIHFGDRQIQEIRYAALLHDFGKVGVPEAILVKAKKLYPLQLEVIKGRFALAQRTLEIDCVQTYEFLKRIPWTQELQNVPMIAYGHHEKLDGSGYPRGLKESDIPIQSQIMAIADIYDALTAGDRPYKSGLPVARVLRILQQEAAHNKLNPELVELFEQRQVFAILERPLEN
ncbi:GAF and HD-GYP domain-containing protein [Leptodesmis sp.]|uniref:GAF and HD-GYP domain-containing protein n=1 Tax=Leptodesmis sp. TaxID=3100501 RepID=UPI0040534B28